jgi:hypothetical protein
VILVVMWFLPDLESRHAIKPPFLLYAYCVSLLVSRHENLQIIKPKRMTCIIHQEHSWSWAGHIARQYIVLVVEVLRENSVMAKSNPCEEMLYGTEGMV